MMSSHPFTPQHVAIRVRKDRSKKRTQHGSPPWVGVVLTGLSLFVLIGLVWSFAERGLVITIRTEPTALTEQI